MRRRRLTVIQSRAPLHSLCAVLEVGQGHTAAQSGRLRLKRGQRGRLERCGEAVGESLNHVR